LGILPDVEGGTLPPAEGREGPPEREKFETTVVSVAHSAGLEARHRNTAARIIPATLRVVCFWKGRNDKRKLNQINL
jgi:hypothetical protein